MTPHLKVAADVGQIVLVLQGGGALGAYHAGVYHALHDAGIEPQWVIGTSIGAINGALIAGNAPAARLDRLREFWMRLGGAPLFDGIAPFPFGGALATLTTLMRGIPGFFELNPFAAWGPQLRLGIERASFYSMAPLKATLSGLIDFTRIRTDAMRLTVGAVSVRTGEMKYFDSRDRVIDLAHVMASGALPPAFPAVRIDGEPYWDGGIYSNTPVEVVLDDMPRRDSLIFAVNVWQPHGEEPDSLWQVVGRHKDIQYASRANSHITRQEQIHRLRHIVKELSARLPAIERDDPAVREMAAYGCTTTMHLVKLLAPRLDGEDHTKDIDFSRAGIRARWQAGYADARQVIEARPWERPTDPLAGVVIHEAAAPV